MATAQTDTGRSNQKKRTRTAIVEAARGLIGTGSEVTMPEVARVALVSEATAYRYFPDLPSLIGEALVNVWPTPSTRSARSPTPATRSNGSRSPASSCSVAPWPARAGCAR